MLSFNLGQWRINIKQQVIVTLLMLAFAIAYFVESRGLSFESLLFPRFLFICIAITGLLSIKKSVHICKIRDVKEEENVEEAQSLYVSKRLLFFVLVSFLLILLFNILGAILSICVFLFVTMYYLGVRKISLLVLVPICTAGVIYGVFKVWLSVPLPSGLLGF